MTSTQHSFDVAAPEPAERTTRVGIVDEYPAQVEGVARAIAEARGMQVVMTATSGKAALDAIREARPDVVIIEPWMRSGDGITCAAQIARDYPEITLVALSRLWDEDHVVESQSTGMVAHLPKTVDLNDLPALLRQAISGIEVRPPTNRSAGSQASLTNREREVLRLASQGMSNTDIAHELFVTEQTVKFHLSNVYRKMGVHNRTEASHRAARAGILG